MYVPWEVELGLDHWRHLSYLRNGVCLTTGSVQNKQGESQKKKVMAANVSTIEPFQSGIV